MLTGLRVENFTIVKLLELDFDQGMTAFTGETGAGKSIMIDALMLALGARADASVIRAGEQKCDISAVFQLDEAEEPMQWLRAHDIDMNDDTLVLRRVLTAESRSKSYINGQPFPLQKVKELSEMLVHIHGQHQHQTLMHHSTHRNQLDRYGKHEVLLAEVAATHKHCQKISQELEALHNAEEQKDRESLLQFQLEELLTLNLKEGELDALNAEHQQLHHANDYQCTTASIIALLSAEDQANIVHQLHQTRQLLHHLPKANPLVKNIDELLHNAAIMCEEALHDTQQFQEQVALNPERLETLENRLSAIHQTARKYRIEAKQLLTHQQTLQEELTALQNRERHIAALEQTLLDAKALYQRAAAALSQARKQAAPLLAQAITTIIQKLGMPKGQVSLDISPLDQGQSHGADKVEYRVCTNPGMEADALNKIASGGELSRISLAIQMITAERGATPTLLFDEVDVGIGGATAALVGQLLRKLGQRLQVFCVTHQPQVAASAHHHFVVLKTILDAQTYSYILPLKAEEKIDEIARMLGGLTITEQTRSHAKELLQQSNDRIPAAMS